MDGRGTDGVVEEVVDGRRTGEVVEEVLDGRGNRRDGGRGVG